MTISRYGISLILWTLENLAKIQVWDVVPPQVCLLSSDDPDTQNNKSCIGSGSIYGEHFRHMPCNHFNKHIFRYHDLCSIQICFNSQHQL